MFSEIFILKPLTILFQFLPESNVYSIIHLISDIAARIVPQSEDPRSSNGTNRL